MYQLICVLLFFSISIANCDPEHARIITVNITGGDDYDFVECSSPNIQEELKDGEQIQLVANTKNNNGTYMRCYDENHNFLMTQYCNTGNQCTHLFTFSTSMRGKWQCVYLMDTDEEFGPTEQYNGKIYTKAICKLNFGTVNSEIDNSKKFECVVNQNIEDRIKFQEQFAIVANTPYNIEYMWCDERKANVIVENCVNSGNQCTSLYSFVFQPNLSKWICTYLMDTKGVVEPNAYVDGIKKYTKATCEFNVKAMGYDYRPLNVEIKLIDNGARVECVSPNEPIRLTDGELVHLEANVPYHVKSMRCENAKQDVFANRCVQTGDNCYSAFHFDKSQEGRWECVYELKTDGTVEPLELDRFGKKVTKATCVLNFETIERRSVILDIKVVGDNGTKSTN